jgi:hypothetical protein
MMALAQAADQEPQLRDLFRELTAGVARLADRLLTRLGLSSTDEHRYLLHAVAVGLAVVDMATARPDGRQRAANVLDTLLKLLALEAASGSAAALTPKPRARPGRARKRRPRLEPAATVQTPIANREDGEGK